MSLYPSLEDMKVDQLARAQIAQTQVAQPVYPVSSHPGSAPSYPGTAPSYPGSAPSYPGSAPSYPGSAPPYGTHPVSQPVTGDKYSNLYPVLDDYMGLQLREHQHHVPTNAVVVQQHQISVPSTRPTTMVAPISSSTPGLVRAQVNHGLREVTLCKDNNGRIGLRVQPINKGVFIILVQKNSPAALAGLRFGDQILMINDIVVAGFSMDEVHKLFKKANPERITMVIRDRPFERTITVHKDSLGTVGFGFKNGKIINIVKDSSAARNGILIDHNLLEVNGQNVVGLKDKEISAIIKDSSSPVTVTIMPNFVYDHMMKNTASSFIKKTMDHSIPDM